jgi:hypothetical protein
MCINDKNNYGWFEDLILLLKIPIGTWKNFFEKHGQFGRVPLERFASPGLSMQSQLCVHSFIIFLLFAVF